MFQLIIRPKAIKTLNDTYDFLEEISQSFNKLQSMPTAYGKIKNNYRQLILKKFPFVLLFEIIGKEIIVYAVFHTGRNPKGKYAN